MFQARTSVPPSLRGQIMERRPAKSLSPQRDSAAAVLEQPTPHHPQSITKPSTQPTAIVPLYSFERADDYVTSSGRPHTGAVDGGGKFDLWNLNADTEVWMWGVRLTGTRRVRQRSNDGKVYVYDIGEMAIPKADEWNQQQKNIAKVISSREMSTSPLVPIRRRLSHCFATGRLTRGGLKCILDMTLEPGNPLWVLQSGIFALV
ncbi:hypothetical protein BC938DRAFT_477091 [Jimgerdemannia flammicorona]|uniref:Uncharacterized protein n=1 Tax=Jimgerdemannia flammicorona TaxID=994334 RepID=A0A433QYZ0_9FUNG|nr:hypothetical protein BC938DRAFT_477091 [Jimgerdemannia flammicorona]